MTYENRKIGTSFERQLCLSLAGYGFWTHRMAQNSQGQPFDIIAARNGNSYPIDCKVCEKDLFKLERIEENQYSSMLLWRDTGNGDGWFALKMNNGAIFFISFSNMEAACVTKTVLSSQEIRLLGVPLGEWVRQCE
jgi:Holliday junction resolvase